MRSQENALTELTYAASVGNTEQVENLLARGLPINAGAQKMCTASCMPMRRACESFKQLQAMAHSEFR
jgi:hypothetical protein